MSLVRIDQASQETSLYISSKFDHLLKNSEEISNYVSNQIDIWSIQSKRNIQINFPYFQYENLLEECGSKAHLEDWSIESFKYFTENYLNFCREIKAPVNRKYWMRPFDTVEFKDSKPTQKKRNLSLDAQLLLQEWQKTMDKVKAEWEINQLELLRQKLLKELEENLSIFQELNDQLAQIGFNFGILFDSSTGSLSAQDIQQFKKWSQYISENQGIQDLCDLLGRLRQIELSEKLEIVNVAKEISVPQPDINSYEEIIGIRLGNDIEYVLPSELALLSDNDSSLLFDLKYIESRLMCFEMQGMQSVIQYHNFEEEIHTTEEDKKGPIILCIDTSGSMHGMPEIIAKAVTLTIVARAKSEKRACYVINFSTQIEVLDFSETMNMKTLVSFLKMSFYGGTDATPALKHALQTMKQENYLKADLIMISDLIMGSLSESLIKDIEIQRENGNKFYSLVIGKSFLSNRMKTLFDQEWVFDPQKSLIHELNNFKDTISLDS